MWSNPGSLHLIAQGTNFRQVCKMRTVRIKYSGWRNTLRKGIDIYFLHCTAVYLEMKISGDWVLPQLRSPVRDS